MRALFLLLILISLTVRAEEKAPTAGGQCYACHLSMDDDAAKAWANDVHATAGIGCESCHGGDASEEDMDLSKSKTPKKPGVRPFRGAPTTADIPALCGSCHGSAEFMKRYNPMLPTDQLEKYLTSVHGKRLKRGDKKVATCISCHQNHGIRKVNDAKSPVYASNLPAMCAKCHANAEYMKEYKIPTNQYDDYVQSVHGKALLEKGDVRGAPACNDCHGNHGATPPGLHTVANICGACHAHNAELFLKSPMAHAFQKDPLFECVACHGNHKILHTSDDWVGDQPGALCVKCHKPGDTGATLAGDLSKAIGAMKRDSRDVERVVEDARMKGMDITEADDQLQAARQSLIQARTELHAFSKPLVEEKLAEGKKALEAALTNGRTALREYMTRRIGLGISSIFLTILVIALAMVIRSLPPPKN